MGKYKFNIIFIICIIVINFCSNVYAMEVNYKKEITEQINNSIKYNKLIYNTDNGFVVAHLLKVKINSNNIDLAPIFSDKGKRYRDTVANMVKEKKYVAGINADFFDMKSAATYPLGTVLKDDKVVMTSSEVNEIKNNFATYFYENNKDSFIDFIDYDIKAELQDGFIDITQYNKIRDLKYPIIYNFKDIEDLDLLNDLEEKMYKIIIIKDKVYKVLKGNQEIKRNKYGYIMIVNEEIYNKYKEQLKKNDKVKIKIDSNMKINNIKWAISGSTKIVDEGRIAVNNGYTIKGRHPRTSIGISEDKNTILLVTVDGRCKNSIGVSEQELAYIMIDNGAYEALNLDGGGSSTMVIKEDDNIKVKNEPSEGTLRKVINGIGVVDNSTESKAISFKVEFNHNMILKDNYTQFDIKFYDKYGHRVEYKNRGCKVYFNNTKVKVVDNKFILNQEGKGTLKFQIGRMKYSKDVEVVSDILAIEGVPVSLSIKEPKDIIVNAVLKDGYRVRLNSEDIIYDINNKEILKIKDNKLYSNIKDRNSGYIHVKYNNHSTCIPVKIGYDSEIIEKFEDIEDFEYVSYPSDIKGYIQKSTASEKDNMNNVKLKYYFNRSDKAQAAYIRFKNPIKINKKIEGISLDVFGDDSNNMLKANITDGNGKNQNITLCRNIDFRGNKKIYADLNNVFGPITINKIYVVSLEQDNSDSGYVYVDNLAIKEKVDFEDIDVLEKQKWNDYKFSEDGNLNYDMIFSKENILKEKIMNDKFIYYPILNADGKVYKECEYIINQFKYSKQNLNNIKQKTVILLINKENINTYNDKVIVSDIINRLVGETNKNVYVLYLNQKTDEIKDGVRYLSLSKHPYIKFFTVKDEVRYTFE